MSLTTVDYFRRRFFLFLPNVCDARCDFCYVRPAYLEHGHLAQGILDRARAVFASMHDAGFEEVRLTGGEPLVFDNLREVGSAAHDAGLRIALLTNGFKITQHIDWMLSDTGPEHVTVSIHSLEPGAGVFGTSRDHQELLEGIRQVVAAGIAVTCSFVSDPRSMDGLDDTVARLSDVGVSDYKVIRANIPGSSSIIFGRMIRRIRTMALPTARVRVSDNDFLRCMLSDEGTLSITLPELEMVPCCATVGGTAFESVTFDATRLEDQLTGLRRSVEAIVDPPCSAHYGSCPIALTGVVDGATPALEAMPA